MSQLFRSSQSLYHVTNCCRMFVSSWLEKPKQIQHQSTEALNCDLFCQSCENKGCIKCPATTEGRSDSSAKEGECCRQRVCLHGDHHMDCSSFFVVVFFSSVFDAESQCGRSRDLCFQRGIIMRSQLLCSVYSRSWLHFYLQRRSSAFRFFFFFFFFSILADN